MHPTFYDNGLNFECTQCHACCRHDPGYVFLSRQDLSTLAGGVGLEPKAFVEKYCRWVDLGEGFVLSLKEKKNYDCIFWDGGCTVYAHRPAQCRTYPFWPGPMTSLEKWKWEGRFCPGINHGKLRDRAEIDAALALRRENPRSPSGGSVRFRFWGVRGSLPCPLSPGALKAKISSVVQRISAADLESPESREKFMACLPVELFGLTGGNTTCVEVEADHGHILVVDGGTGLRDLGNDREAESSEPKHYHILFTHFHWDHLQGIPFFSGLFHPRNRVTFYSPVKGFEELVRAQMREPYFPVTLASYPAQVNFVELGTGPFLVGGTEVRWKEVNHPGSCVAYRFKRNEKILVFSTDTELRPEDFEKNDDNCSFFFGIDVLILDAQYTLGESIDRAEWGHSSSSLDVDFSLDFAVKMLYLFHHEPGHDDTRIEEIGRTSQWYADHKRPGHLLVRVAREGAWEKIS